MDAKLTLKLDKSVVEQAKQYASAHKKSLSRMVETYLKALLEKEDPSSSEDMDISPFVRSMQTGVNIPVDLDHKKVYGDYLNEKYK